jgi:glucose/arabinose dehydrogenase
MSRPRLAALVALLGSVLIACQAAVPAPTSPAGNSDAYRDDLEGLPAFEMAQEMDGFRLPVLVTHVPGETGELYVVEQGGRIELATGSAGEWQRQGTFLDISDKVIAPGAELCWEQEFHNERGLLGLAFPPDHHATGLFYLTYTMIAGCDDPNRGAIVLSEFTRRDGEAADPGSERILLTVPKPPTRQEAGLGKPRPNHNGGLLAFGPDGYLWVSIGEGGQGGGPLARAMDTHLGKMLRIDPAAQGDRPYGIPSGNPYPDGPLPEIWAIGLRNPWRWSFDRQTGDLWIGDVGQFRFEEVNYAPADGDGRDPARGMDFGWSPCEGAHLNVGRNAPEPGPCTTGVLPLHEYPHADGACAVTGGHVLRDPYPAESQGVYVFADFCDGKLRALLPSGENLTLAELGIPVPTFGEDAEGWIYVTDLRGGAVHRLLTGEPGP